MRRPGGLCAREEHPARLRTHQGGPRAAPGLGRMASGPGEGGADGRGRRGGRPRRRPGSPADAGQVAERVLRAPGGDRGGRRCGRLPEHREAVAEQGHATRVRRPREVAAGPRGEAARGGSAQAAGGRRDAAPRHPPEPAKGRGEGRGRRADRRAQAHHGAHHGPGRDAALPPARLRGGRRPRRRLRQGEGSEEQEGQGPCGRGHREEARGGHPGRARHGLHAAGGCGLGWRALGRARRVAVHPGDRDVRAGPDLCG
mmetsp:Transcript_39375/g.116749  ORF Transcript_39375/g.116749 Transcript_39375/m.116749 type:complete len:257 (-) Transcript_39375:314-1084(-)